MNPRFVFVIVAGIALAFLAAGCQQPKSEQASALSAEDTAAIEKTIDSAITTYVAKDLDKYLANFSPAMVNMEYDRRYVGIAEFRDRHVKPEMEMETMTTYKAADRRIQGRGSFAYVDQREIIAWKENSGKSYASESFWASYILEKQKDGNWKIVQLHFSGPSL
jgi:ketosteroid isomerase-like protein